VNERVVKVAPSSEEGEPVRGRGVAFFGWWLAHLRPWIVTALVVGFMFATFREFRALDFHALRDALRHVDRSLGFLSLGLALANVAAMGLYDVVALGRPWGSPPASARLRIGSLAFAMSNLVATGPLAGPALRLWLYREIGVSADRIVRATAEAMIGLSVGHVLLLAGVWLAPVHRWPAGVAVALGLAVAAGVVAERVPRSARLAASWLSVEGRWPVLFVVGVLDWALATVVFLVVLASFRLLDLSSPHATLVFLLGHAAGAASLVPGGLGAADAAWLYGLSTPKTASRVAAAILVFRFFYYIVPFVLAAFVLVTRATARRPRALYATRAVCSLAVGAAGILVLASVATPAIGHRLHVVGGSLPKGLIEASHGAAALAGLLLVVLSRALRRGFRAAMIVAGALLALGAAACVFKGGDWEEAVVLSVVVALLFRHHRAFTRPGAWELLRVEPGDFAAGVAAVVAVTLLAAWAFREVPYAHSLWLRFELYGDAQRALRALAMVALALSLVGLWILLRPPRRTPTGEEIGTAIARTLAAPAAGSTPLMVANGDKSVWLYGDRGFALYGTIGNALVVLGDPVAPPGEEDDMLDEFLGFCETECWDVVFYQVSARWFPHLHDQGFELMKLGEEGVVDLAGFTLQGKAGKGLRYVLNQMKRFGISIRVLAPEEVVKRIAELGAVSDTWLETKRVAEKRFSVGFFDVNYLRRFPAVVAETPDGEIVAFANLLPGAPGGEASVDLMRQRPGAPEGTMDAVIVAAIEWARSQGYARFSLGMAPLSTVGESRRAPFWERASRLVYRHGEPLYNFRGLRQYKEKFRPRWEPRYLASSRTWDWPRQIATIAALVAGGWWRVVRPDGRRRTLTAKG
jgi:phosphatidylglycerol lysyltransferase